MIVDKFCEFYLRNPGDIYKRYNEFITETDAEITFEEFKDCIKTGNNLASIDSNILKKFIEFMEER